MKIITRTVWILSFISLLTDVASEMLYPVMPVYLRSINFSIFLIGVLEGVAEATAGLSKGYFGKLSDNTGKRVPFVRLGYLLSAISKPLMAAFIYPAWIFFVRTIDRFGKGLRTGARDAMLSDEATTETKGRVFGFHRSMDTVGAVAGPSLALLFLLIYPGEYKWLFILAGIPGVLAIIFTLMLKDKTASKKSVVAKTSFFDFLKYFKSAPADYKKLVFGLLAFAVINSSDVFLLLKIKESGASDTITIGSYIFYNIIYAILAYPIGILADKIGLKRVFVIGLLIFSLAYFLMGTGNQDFVFVIAFVLYAIYAASTEGISKAWISNMVDKGDTATAIGTYTGFQSICALIASSLTGLIWLKFGGEPALLITSVFSALIMIYILISVKAPPRKAEMSTAKSA
jgi:MFS family permease